MFHKVPVLSIVTFVASLYLCQCSENLDLCPTYLGTSSDGRIYFSQNATFLNWTEAGDLCRECGLVQATIETAAQKDFLKQALCVPDSNEQYWVAAHEDRGSWQFLTWDPKGNALPFEEVFDSIADASGGPDITPYQLCGMFEAKFCNEGWIVVKPCRHGQKILCTV